MARLETFGGIEEDVVMTNVGSWSEGCSAVLRGTFVNVERSDGLMDFVGKKISSPPGLCVVLVVRRCCPQAGCSL